MKPTTETVLKAAINRFLDDGVREYSKRDLGTFGGQNWTEIKALLARWESRGLLRIVQPLDDAHDNEIVIEMLNYIDQDSPWPNWPPKSTTA